MASDSVVERIVHLLRIAADRAGTPEGDNAAAHARRLMQTHDVQVILGDIPPEEQPRNREVAEDLGSFDAREAWMEEISHVVGRIYDAAPVWYFTNEGRVGLAMFDAYGDVVRLRSARDFFFELVRIVTAEPMPRRLLHAVPPARAAAMYRAGISHAIGTRYANFGQIPRAPEGELPSNDEVVALVPIRTHRRPRHAFVDPTLDVPIQGGVDDWASGSEAALFAHGVIAGNRTYLPTPAVDEQLALP